MISIVIPSYKDPYLHNTIDDILLKARGDIEIIVVLDGYWPEKELRDDKRIRVVHLGENQGMRGAINAGAAVARGKYLMRTDEHCMFGEGFDKVLTQVFDHNWIQTPRRYFLDPVKWEVMDLPYIDHEKLIIDKTHNKFAAVPCRDWDIQRSPCNRSEKTAMQGSCWIMHKDWWDKVIVELDTATYGTHYQDSVEMCFKTWEAGGRLMINKDTWYAHKHRDFPRTHSYPNDQAKASFEAALAKHTDYFNRCIKCKWE